MAISELDKLKAEAETLNIDIEGLTKDEIADRIKQVKDASKKTKKVKPSTPTLTQDEIDRAIEAINGQSFGEKPSPADRRLIAKYTNMKRQEAETLVRIIVTPADTNKLQLEGEIITGTNNLLPSYKKFIPFNNEKGWHVSTLLYNILKEKETTIFVKKRKGNTTISEPRTIKAYNITVLPPLTKDELKALAEEQKARNSIKD